MSRDWQQIEPSAQLSAAHLNVEADEALAPASTKAAPSTGTAATREPRRCSMLR
eukprot:CAMPEP_0176266080 /NCGR_PEP_ID=MMETSP0121_2-20121125/42469_1 /TAXON_ID=160619 /ORGANISM="Kryptoperidinium foliaceum, Strain CCMP 1326" /LENGTH=53 /DNA_ID=CAMNT_0017606121 /DNA_START=1 /DNA_END=159 /DNA_ORIENTATION=+